MFPQNLLQTFFGQDDPLRICEPQIEADALAVEHEEPTVNVGARGNGRQAAPEREVLRLAVFREASEFNPGITHPPLVSPEQQIPRHLFARIPVGFKARRLGLGVEQKWQRQR